MPERTFRIELTVEDQLLANANNPYDCPGYRGVKRVLPNIRAFTYFHFRLYPVDAIGDHKRAIPIRVPIDVGHHLLNLAMDRDDGLPPRVEHKSFEVTIPEGYY